MTMFLITIPLIGTPGMMELLVIAGVIILVFGAAKLPKLGKGLGEGIRNFKSGLKGEEEKSTEIKKKEEEDSSESE